MWSLKPGHLENDKNSFRIFYVLYFMENHRSYWFNTVERLDTYEKSSSERPVNFNPASHFQSEVPVSSHNPFEPYTHIAIRNLCPCVGLFCDDAPL